MIPARFIVEYPKRCIELLDRLEPIARQDRVLASFGLLSAAAVFLIPYERIKGAERDTGLGRALRRLDQSGKFLSAPFWKDQPTGDWRMSRIMTRPDDSECWKDPEGRHPMSPAARNWIQDKRPGDVLRVIRNAIAHGNIVYLNERGIEAPMEQVRYIAFISHYREGSETRDGTYRLVATTEEEFIRFARSWAAWLATFHHKSAFSEAA